MTPRQAIRAARSLNYRRRLNEKVPELEEKLKGFLRKRKDREKVSALLGSYKVTLKNENLTIEEVDPIDPNQLTFKFLKGEENEDRKSGEGKESKVRRG